MTAAGTMVIVGAGLTGAKAAEALRDEGFDGRVFLLGDEAERPYERPPLSKDYLRGESDRAKVYVHDEGFYADNAIELMAGCPVTALDTAAHEVVAGDRERIVYDRLLLAVGAEPRRLAVAGADMDGVLYLRSLADSDALRARLGSGGRVVVVGAGWIGAEVAASARQAGLEVTLLERTRVPLEGVLGADLGAFYRDVHVDHGVRFVGGVQVAGFEGAGRVEAVRLDDGRSLECDFAVVGVGAVPRTGLAEAAGIHVDNGIVVDAALRTSAPDVFAAGDVANALHPHYGTHVRVEHWANALNQGPAAARAMLGRDVAYERLPYFFSDQFDVGMEYSGLSRPDDRVVYRGDPSTREFIAFWVRDDRVVAGMNVNVWDVTVPIQDLIRSRAAVNLSGLADPDVPLEDLASAATVGD